MKMKRGPEMIRRIRPVLILLALLLFAGCAGEGNPKEEPAFRQSEIWTLGSRYDAEYSQISYFLAYRKDGNAFRMLISRSQKPAGSSKDAIETFEKDGVVCALCEGYTVVGTDAETFSYYECFDGQFRYRIGIEQDGFRAEDVLSFEDAIALIVSPETLPEGIVLTEREWNAYFKTPSCNLDVMICPDDGGALTRSLPSSFSEKTEDGETIYVSEIGDTIVWTDGASSVEIRQVSRADTEPASYNTLSECRALLSLLGSK
jgi:hypothetical protein